MSGIRGFPLRKIVVLFLFGLLMPLPAGATNYKQPAYITNIYFCSNPVQQGESIQPDKVVTLLKANDPREAVHLVLNLVGNKGTHQLVVEVLDKDAKVLPVQLKLEPWTNANDDGMFAATARFAGSFPVGGIFFKIYDIYNNKAKEVIGLVRMMTAQW